MTQSPAVTALNADEERWLERHLEIAAGLAAQIGLQTGPIAPEDLDVAYAACRDELVNMETDQAELNMIVNAFGAALGDYLVTNLGFKWVIAEDESGTDLAAYRPEGSILLYPMNFVGRRFAAQDEAFFVPYCERVTAQVQELTA